MPLTLYLHAAQHSLLEMFADNFGLSKTNQTMRNHYTGTLYPIQTIFNHRSRDQLLEFRSSFYETISSEFLVQGISSTLYFYESIGTDGTVYAN